MIVFMIAAWICIFVLALAIVGLRDRIETLQRRVWQLENNPEMQLQDGPQTGRSQGAMLAAKVALATARQNNK